MAETIFPCQFSDPADEPDWYVGPGWYRKAADGTVEWAGFTRDQALGLDP